MTALASDSTLPSFDNPPVIEVVCGIQFKPLENLYVPHFGELWKRFPDYPHCNEAIPILPVIERFDAASLTDLQQPMDVPLPRVWFYTENETGLIQVQRDRFLHNWKKVKPSDEYPRYGRVKQLFEEHLATFEKFLSDYDLSTIIPSQYEMTYVNHIPQGQGWNELADLRNVFPDFAWRAEDDRFLPVPEGRQLRLSFLVSDKTARLHATIRTAERRDDKRGVVLFELTVRGIAPDSSKDAMWHWFDMARTWIVRGFADLTGDEIQRNVWRRTQ